MPFMIMLQLIKEFLQQCFEDNINHIIRTLRVFLEGFALLVTNDAFGNPLPIKDSFDLSLEIIINGIKTLEGVN